VLALFGSFIHTIGALEPLLPKYVFELAQRSRFVQTALVATECGAVGRILKRRATFLAGVTQPVHSNLGHLVVAHIAILNMYLKKSLRLF
jgi:hypothetical protein